MFFKLLLFFFGNQGESANAALLSPPPARGPWERLSERCENTKSCCFSPLHGRVPPPPPTPPPPLCLASDRLAAGCCGAPVLMNEVFPAATSEVRCSDTRSLGAEVAGRRPVSAFIRRRSNSARDELIILSPISLQHKQPVFYS